MPSIHRITSAVAGTPVNAYVVEGERDVVVVDGTLTVSGGRAVRQRVIDTGKRLSAVVLTHSHPDHYGGIVEVVAGSDVPIVAAPGVDEVIRRDDSLKEGILRPMFGDEWPRERAFPTELAHDGAELTFGDIQLELRDLGPGESHHDTIWLLDGGATVFSGDQAYNHMHCYLADGHWKEWLGNIESLAADLRPDAVLHVGHGEPAGLDLLAWQRGYIERFVEAVRSADWSNEDRAKADVTAAMGTYLPSEDLRFLMELSIEPVATGLGVWSSDVRPGV